MAEPASLSEGWGVLHLFCRIRPDAEREAVATALKAAQDADHQVVTVAMLGHKADVGFMALGPDLWRLRALQTAIGHAGLELASSYVSLTEVSEYAQGLPTQARQNRLYPRLPPPGKPAFCFYPMSKRRNAGQNWYELPYERRRELMVGHGSVGRSFAGRVLQLVTGSVGLDDFEWGVTLFGVRHGDLKEIVYKMRFDQVSVHYAEFGPFYSGIVAAPDEVFDRVGLI